MESFALTDGELPRASWLNVALSCCDMALPGVSVKMREDLKACTMAAHTLHMREAQLANRRRPTPGLRSSPGSRCAAPCLCRILVNLLRMHVPPIRGLTEHRCRIGRGGSGALPGARSYNGIRYVAGSPVDIMAASTPYIVGISRSPWHCYKLDLA